MRSHRGPDPSNPVDTPLAAVERRLDADGYEGQFRAVLDGLLECLSCTAVFPAADQRADRVTRLEGASDPADLVIVVPIVCPACGTAGTFVAPYGPEASEAEASVLTALPRHPTEGSGERDATPGVR